MYKLLAVLAAVLVVGVVVGFGIGRWSIVNMPEEVSIRAPAPQVPQAEPQQEPQIAPQRVSAAQACDQRGGTLHEDGECHTEGDKRCSNVAGLVWIAGTQTCVPWPPSNNATQNPEHCNLPNTVFVPDLGRCVVRLN